MLRGKRKRNRNVKREEKNGHKCFKREEGSGTNLKECIGKATQILRRKRERWKMENRPINGKREEGNGLKC